MSVVPFALGWSVIGLFYDIVGAIFLAYAIFFNSPAKIAHQAATYWNSSPFAIRALAEQTVDARAGLILLVVGFVLQIVGQWHSSGNVYGSVSLLALLLAFVIAHLAFLRNRFTDRLVARVKAHENRDGESE